MSAISGITYVDVNRLQKCRPKCEFLINIHLRGCKYGRLADYDDEDYDGVLPTNWEIALDIKKLVEDLHASRI